MKINKKAKRKSSKNHTLRSSVIFIFIAVIALLSLWMPALF